MFATARLGSRYILAFVLAVLLLWTWRSYGNRPMLRMGRFKYVASSYDWSKAKTYHPVTDMKNMPTGQSKQLPKVQKVASSPTKDPVAEERKEIIKSKFVKSWNAYKKYAWKADELRPLSKKGAETFSGWGAQLVDALDGLWIMGLKDDFYAGVQEVAVIDWYDTHDQAINLFEVTIRYLGGLLAAYDLSQESVLLRKAVELGDTLYATFDTPNRLPSHWLNYGRAKAGTQTADTLMSIAAGGTLCLEFTRLSQITGDPKYYDATERLKLMFHRLQNDTDVPGLWTHDINYYKEELINSRFSLGGGADSMYEYLPKMHQLLSGMDPQYEQMATTSLQAAKDWLLFKPMTIKDEDILLPGSGIMSQGVKDFSTEAEHLACFAGGMYALAGKLLANQDFVHTGARLTSGCVWLYDVMPGKIMAENQQLHACESKTGPCEYDPKFFKGYLSEGLPPGLVACRSKHYSSRPEAIESVYYMWRITRDQKWRDAAWRMWEGIVAASETDEAFATVRDVTRVPIAGGGWEDRMEVSSCSHSL